MDSLFIDNKYYFYRSQTTLSIATANDFSPITDYYTIISSTIVPYFYLMNCYYWRLDENDIYTIDRSFSMRENG